MTDRNDPIAVEQAVSMSRMDSSNPNVKSPVNMPQTTSTQFPNTTSTQFPNTTSTTFPESPTSSVSEVSKKDDAQRKTNGGVLLGLGLGGVDCDTPWNPKRNSEKHANMRADVEPFTPIHGAMGFLNADSTPDDVSPDLTQSALEQKAAEVQPIGSGTRTSPRGSFFPVHKGPAFTTDGDINVIGSRYIEFGGIPVHWLRNGHLAKALKDCGLANKLRSCAPAYGAAGTLNLSVWFDDLHSAQLSRDAFAVVLTTVTFKYIDHFQYFGVDSTSPYAQKCSVYDGQVEFRVSVVGNTDMQDVLKHVFDFAAAYGDVRCMALLEKSSKDMVFFRVEFYAVSAAEAVTYKGENSEPIPLTNDLTVEAHDYAPEGYSRYCHPAALQSIHSLGLVPVAAAATLGPVDLDQSAAFPPISELSLNDQSAVFPMPSSIQESSTRRTAWYGDEPVSPQAVKNLGSDRHASQYRQPVRFEPQHAGEPYGYVQESNRATSFHDRRRNDTANQPQNVVPSKIELGQDVRTTVMLRNLPNMVDTVALKEMLDHTSKGHYDFTYLRVDFSNNCNVGYAFINFVRPEFITHFVKHRVGRPWKCFGSKKIAEVSYATIQGQDCLVAKFRNSSVMQEFSGFRPKVFYNVDSTDVPVGKEPGDEAPFPAPDNPSKLQRSLDNAQTAGLYPPRAGQRAREERRYRSQWDRGNPRAVAEELQFAQHTRSPEQFVEEPQMVPVTIWVDPRHQNAVNISRNEQGLRGQSDLQLSHRGDSRDDRQYNTGFRGSDFHGDYRGNHHDSYSGPPSHAYRDHSCDGRRTAGYRDEQQHRQRGSYHGERGGFRGQQRDEFQSRRDFFTSRPQYGPRDNGPRPQYGARDNNARSRNQMSRPSRSHSYYDDEY